MLSVPFYFFMIVNVIMLSVIILNFIMLNAIMLSFIILSVGAPVSHTQQNYITPNGIRWTRNAY